MSIVIKSNKTANKGFQSDAALNTTPTKVFDSYKSRVQADGGTISNEQKTKDIIQWLFDSNFYGRSNTVVSPFFGIKKSGTGVTKLYSIDGYDLDLVVEGTGVAPVIDSAGYLDFGSNEGKSGNNGAYYRTADKHLLSDDGAIASSLSFPDHTLVGTSPVICYSTLETPRKPPFTAARLANGQVDFRLTTSSGVQSTVTRVSSDNGVFGHYYNPVLKYAYMYNSAGLGSKILVKDRLSTDIDYPHYVILGGQIDTSLKWLFAGKLGFAASFKNIPSFERQKLASFTAL